MKKIKVIGFDADDTLWLNEPYFHEAEEKFFHIIKKYCDVKEKIKNTIYQMQISNLRLYGYGIKSYILALIETAITLSESKITADETHQLIKIGQDMLTKPVHILENVESTLDFLSDNFALIVITKGDLLDQQRKIKESGLEKYFSHTEIVSDKTPEAYRDLLNRLKIAPSEFMMVGNSLMSDVLPVVEIGASACHLPFHTTWEHEIPKEQDLINRQYHELESLLELWHIVS